MATENSPFEVGKTYRNENGAYQVLALHGDTMTIQYENGHEQTVRIAIQARIWERLQVPAAPPPRPQRPRDDENLETQPIADLVQRVLATLRPPHPANVIDQVCLAIEGSPAWRREYDALVEHFSSQGKDGKLTVNAFIGWHVRDQTGMITVKAGNIAQSRLIQSYSSLRYPTAGERTLWPLVRQLVGRTLVTLDQQRPFTITAVTADKITVMPHIHDIERSIPREAVEGAWLELVQHGELSRQDVKREYSAWNPAYVTAVLAEMPGVTHQIRPIVLFYKKQ